MNEEVTKTSFCKKSYTEDGVATFAFGNGESVSINVNELPEEQQFNLMMHGMMQKGGDSFASAKGDYTFAVAAVQKIKEQLENNQWTASRGSAGEGAPRIGELAQAIANLKNLDVAAVAAAIEKATDDQRKAWRKNAAISAEILRIRAEKAQARAAAAGTGTIDDVQF